MARVVLPRRSAGKPTAVQPTAVTITVEEAAIDEH
jgi:hypothetical protein